MVRLNNFTFLFLFLSSRGIEPLVAHIPILLQRTTFTNRITCPSSYYIYFFNVQTFILHITFCNILINNTFLHFVIYFPVHLKSGQTLYSLLFCYLTVWYIHSHTHTAEMIRIELIVTTSKK